MFWGLLECGGPWPGTDRLPLFTIHFVVSNFEENIGSSLQHSILRGANQDLRSRKTGSYSPHTLIGVGHH
jgi:hypothetical protein